MKRHLVELVALVVLAEGLVQLLVGDPDLAQLLAPGGSPFTIALVAAALALRVLVLVGLPSVLVYAVVAGLLRRGPRVEGEPAAPPLSRGGDDGPLPS